MRLWVICYDIADNRRRRELAKCLSQRMERTQESVFEGWLNYMEIGEIIGKVKEIIDPSEDSVRAYPLALRCEKNCRTFGQQSSAKRPEEYWIVG